MSNKNSYKAFPLIAIPILIKDCWNTVMTIEHSPLRKLDPMVAHMVFTILGFMWSAIFGIALAVVFMSHSFVSIFM